LQWLGGKRRRNRNSYIRAAVFHCFFTRTHIVGSSFPDEWLRNFKEQSPFQRSNVLWRNDLLREPYLTIDRQTIG
ncbi:MAG: hypothetical protein ABR973_02190, partial [Candidatus Acidiferrales bacterium]